MGRTRDRLGRLLRKGKVKYSILAGTCLLLSVMGPVCGKSPEMQTYTHTLEVGISAPPAFLFVEDAQGRRTGTNPDTSVDEFGRGQVLEEIPRSFVRQDNIENNETGEPSPFTWWAVIVPEASGDYRVQVQALKTGLALVSVDLVAQVTDPTPNPKSFRLGILASPGTVKTFEITADRTAGLLQVERKVTSTGFASSMATACDLKMVEPSGLCQSFKAKAEAISDAVGRSNSQAARGQLQAFLNELKAQAGKHIKEPAATILREEAEALLKSLDGEGAKEQEAARPKRWWWPLNWFGS